MATLLLTATLHKMELTDEQLSIAARELCGMRGIDPDKLYGWQSNEGEARQEIKRLLDIQTAIAFALEQTIVEK